MKALTFAMRSFGRELRSGEVVVLLSAVILAVAALTAVGFLTDRIGKAVERQANEVLAADLRLRSQDPIPDAWRDLAAEYELRTADMVSFPTVVFAGDESGRRSRSGRGVGGQRLAGAGWRRPWRHALGR
jgi:putative ABC transport system permease protein